jgi:hypothetical protein
MLALMLDPYYKSLQAVKNCVGHGNAIHLTFKYENHPTSYDSF